MEHMEAQMQARYEAYEESMKADAKPIGYCVWINGKLAGCAKSHKGAFPVYAAAPDLLETLYACEKQAEEIRLILINHLNEPERSAFWKAINIREFARAAIAKATGSQP